MVSVALASTDEQHQLAARAFCVKGFGQFTQTASHKLFMKFGQLSSNCRVAIPENFKSISKRRGNPVRSFVKNEGRRNRPQCFQLRPARHGSSRQKSVEQNLI